MGTRHRARGVGRLRRRLARPDGALGGGRARSRRRAAPRPRRVDVPSDITGKRGRALVVAVPDLAFCDQQLDRGRGSTDRARRRLSLRAPARCQAARGGDGVRWQRHVGNAARLARLVIGPPAQRLERRAPASSASLVPDVVPRAEVGHDTVRRRSRRPRGLVRTRPPRRAAGVRRAVDALRLARRSRAPR